MLDKYHRSKCVKFDLQDLKANIGAGETNKSFKKKLIEFSRYI